MKTRTFLLAALALALLPVSARQSLPDSSTPAWIQEFNNLPETTRKSYIAQFRKAEQLFAQKRIMECLFSLMELEKLYAGNPGLYNLRGACYIEIRNIEKALENFEKAQKLDPSNLTIQCSESVHGTPSPLQGQSRHDAPAAIQALYLRPQTG